MSVFNGSVHLTSEAGFLLYLYRAKRKNHNLRQPYYSGKRGVQESTLNLFVKFYVSLFNQL